MQHFHLLTLFDLTLTFIQYKVHTYMLPSSSRGKPLANFEFAAVGSLVLGADKAKSEDFDIRPDLDISCDLLNIFLITL